MEIWTGRIIDNSLKFCLEPHNEIQLDPKLGRMTLADMNADGFLDLVFSSIDGDNHSIKVFLNSTKKNDYFEEDYCDHIAKEKAAPAAVFNFSDTSLVTL